MSRAKRATALVACTQVQVTYWCGGAVRRLGHVAWGFPTSNRTQSRYLSGRGSWRSTCKVSSPFIAANPLQLDVGLAFLAVTTRLIQGLAAKVRYVQNHAPCNVEGMRPEELQETLWQQCSPDTTQWQDNTRSNLTPRHPDLRHKNSKIAHCLGKVHKPACVDSQLVTWDAGMTRPPEFATIAFQGVGSFEDHSDRGLWRKVCEDGRTSDVADALKNLVQRGCYIPRNIFYRVIKRCIADKDLVQGRRIHALTVKHGHEGDAFLATHLIALYASHERLEEAMRVFAKVSTPDVYNWATIILAYAKHGEASQAIRLYQQMHESTIEPTDHIYVAVLKACAAVGDLVTGKEVHAHILSSPGNPDIFVQTGVVNMYAKCGSLENARRVFENLPQKDVVTWTTMIAGYTQHGMGQEALTLYSSMRQEGIHTPNSVTFVCLLQACAGIGVGALDQGKQLHAATKEQGLRSDVVVGGSVVNMYVKCGSLGDARSAFDKLPIKNVVTWTAMIAGYAEQGMGEEALVLYNAMQQEGVSPNSVTYVCLLQACGIVSALPLGKQLHAQIEERGLHYNVVLGGSLVNMYAKCGSLVDARSLFDRLPYRNVVTWNAMLTGYAQQGLGQEALTIFNSMQQEGLTAPDSVTFVSVLQSCASVGVEALHLGKQLHAQIEERGLQDDVILCGSMVNMYSRCGRLCDARRVFNRLPKRNVQTWNALLSGYVQQGMGEEALSLFKSMQQEGIPSPDSVTFICVLQGCASVGVAALHEGKLLHAQIEERGLQDDVVLGGSIVTMYARCGNLEDARRVFDRLIERNVVAWNALLAGYAQQGMFQEALSLYNAVQREGIPPTNSGTFVYLLQACAGVGPGALSQGKQLHAEIEERKLQTDLVLGGSLVNMYAKCGNLDEARSVFNRLPDRNVVTWTAMITGYAQEGMLQEALSLYDSMQQEDLTPPDSVIFVCLLQACAGVGVGALHGGKKLHAQIEEWDLQDNVALGGSLVNMYAKCGSLEDARSVFDRVGDRNVVTWTSMIAGYTDQGMGWEALCLYSSMQQEGCTVPNSVTFVCLLQACAIVAALPSGKRLHAQIEELGLQRDLVVGVALVNMYAKCGSMVDAQQVFDSLPERTIEAWNSLTGGYTRQGDSEVVFGLLDRMRLEGAQPDNITFLSLLTACSHAGLVEKGQKYFEAMWTDYGISPTLEHYTCMMDVLGRAGHLDEALRMAKSMPFPPNGVVWRTLLSSCRKWKNVEIGQQAFELAVIVDGKDAAAHVLMSNIYESAEMWEEAKEMQLRRLKLEAWKEPGQSWWTDMGGVVHTFGVGDKRHVGSKGIYARL